MTVPFPPLIRGWRAALLLAAVALSTPGTASAGCGDYITYPNSRPDAHSAPMSPATDDATPAPAKTPCQGPNCSGAPVREFPPVPPAPVTNPTKQQARHLGVTDLPNLEPGSAFARDLTSPRPIRRATSVFHPPRLG
jgi:hypothetical protein